MCWEGGKTELTLGAGLECGPLWDDESSLPNRDYRVGHAGPEVPDKVG